VDRDMRGRPESVSPYRPMPRDIPENPDRDAGAADYNSPSGKGDGRSCDWFRRREFTSRRGSESFHELAIFWPPLQARLALTSREAKKDWRGTSMSVGRRLEKVTPVRPSRAS